MVNSFEITADISTHNEYEAIVNGNTSPFDAEVINGFDKNFVFTQGTASAEWIVQHNLNKFCSVTVVDSANTVVIGEINYVDKNNIVISFNAEFTGKAYLN